MKKLVRHVLMALGAILLLIGGVLLASLLYPYVRIADYARAALLEIPH